MAVPESPSNEWTPLNRPLKYKPEALVKDAGACNARDFPCHSLALQACNVFFNGLLRGAVQRLRSIVQKGQLTYVHYFAILPEAGRPGRLARGAKSRLGDGSPSEPLFLARDDGRYACGRSVLVPSAANGLKCSAQLLAALPSPLTPPTGSLAGATAARESSWWAGRYSRRTQQEDATAARTRYFPRRGLSETRVPNFDGGNELERSPNPETPPAAHLEVEGMDEVLEGQQVQDGWNCPASSRAPRPLATTLSPLIRRRAQGACGGRGAACGSVPGIRGMA